MHRVMSILASVLLAAVLAVGCKSKSEDKGQPTAVVEPAAGETPALAKKGVAPAKDAPLLAKKEPAPAKEASAKPAASSAGLRAILLEGRKAYNANDIFKAVELFTTAVRQAPDRTEPLVDLARALYRKGALQQSLETLERALRMDEEDAFARLNLGHILVRDGQNSQGLKQLYKALKLKPEHPDVLCGLLFDVKKLDLKAAVDEAVGLAKAAGVNCPEEQDPLTTYRDVEQPK